MRHSVFITGGTGYIGSRLVPRLVARGHTVRALVRAASVAKLPNGCEPVLGDALEVATFAHTIQPCDTFVQLVGVPHPSPAKAEEFRRIDLASARASIGAAARAGVCHFVYVSVAQPAPVMRDYVAARAEAEQLLRESGMPATVLRPWYVLGPGHRWPWLLAPLYVVAERLPASRDAARRLGLVTVEQMLAALVRAVERPAEGVQVMDVPDIKAAARA